MGRVRSKRSAILGVGSLLGFAALGFSLSAGAALGRDRLAELPPLPPPLCRTESWVESQAETAAALGVALSSGETGEGVEESQTSLAAHGWDGVPSLILAWRRLDLEDDGQARSGAALAEWFNGLALGSTLDWHSGQGMANRDAVADLYASYLEARVRNWPSIGDESSPDFLVARVWADDLLREGASRTEVRDARKGLGEAEWMAVPAVLGALQRVDLGDPEISKKIKAILRLMERFPGAPDGDWSEGTRVSDRLANIALLEEYMSAALAAPLRELPPLSRPSLVSKRDWVQWERDVDEFVDASEEASRADALVSAGPQVRPVIVNAMLTLDILDGRDYIAGGALDGVLRRIVPDSKTPPWMGIEGSHPSISTRDAILAWHGGGPRRSGNGVAAGSIGGKFGGRAGGRRRLASQGGQPIATAIGDGLLWLASNQRDNGSWSAYPWSDEDGKPTGNHEAGLTGLALLAFLADGQTHDDALYDESIQRGIQWLLDTQNSETGVFGKPSAHDSIYDHAIATQAMAEYAAQTGKDAAFESTTLAVAYLEQQQTEAGGWRYEKAMGGGDTSVTAWIVSALAAARTADVEVDPESMELANGWFDAVTDPESGRAGYTEPGTTSARILNVNDHFPPEYTEALSAAALWGSIVCSDEPEKNARLEGYAKLLAASLPTWETEYIDFYYWYWGALGTWQMGGKSHWDPWDKSLRKALLPNQRQDDKFKGSWDPVGPWCMQGRRVYSTAMGVLILETHYRYERLLR